MKITNTKIALSTLFLGLFYAGSCVAAVQVDLAVETDNGVDKLVVKANDKHCGGGEPLGCIDVEKGSSPHMYFNLPKACKRDGPQYKLKKFRIRATASKSDWPTNSNPLPKKIADDFCANRYTGYVAVASCRNDQDNDRLKIKNFNKVATNVWYDIIAESCSDSDVEISLDPQIKNGGTQDR